MLTIKKMMSVCLLAGLSTSAFSQVNLLESDRWLLAIGSETMARNVEICDPTLSNIKEIYQKEAKRYWSFAPQHISRNDVEDLKKVVKLGADKTKANMLATGVNIAEFCDKLKADIEITVGSIKDIDKKYSPMKGIDVADGYFTGIVQVVFKAFESYSVAKPVK